ncbi:hypothetical protein AQF52_7730 [Streptomyces venezuelae]|uniref:hypothetical protein n=1 Tax=Streptomyces gardneri TaxID=66892 RepID=UPI00071F41A2|nr:hypothetical protein [Streptomyces gardneri]ALO13316.1 hypothetical protein AQF52_7730 [Streptomyces venezuelae]QPK49967.1 hypothetical protein H4W23_38785 [Streptomyces gardneri]WRK41540.1 hypothetical protein U0M97_39020 [Streptomyces venezuelae]
MLIYAFRDARGVWHGDPGAVLPGIEPGRGVLTLPSTVPGQDPGAFDGQRVEVLYAGCDREASEATYRLDSGETFLATWHVHELLSPAYRGVVAAPAAAQDATTTVRLEVGGPHRRYNLHAELVAEGRVEIKVVVSSPDGVIHGELAGELDPRDLGEIGRHLASVARTSSFTAPPAEVNLVPAPRTPAEREEPKAYTVEEKRRIYPNAYKPWEPADEQRLAERCAQGVSLLDLSKEFGRNEGAIASRLVKIQAEGPAAEEAWEYGG